MRERIGTIAWLLALAVAAAAPATASDAWLPLGDGRISHAPEGGSVFVCPARFEGGGAHREDDWIRGDRWNPDRKPVVDGRVIWPNARIAIALDGAERVVRGNHLPTHPTGRYPVSRDDDAYLYDRNPNRILEREVLLRLPAEPRPASAPSCVPMGMIGLAVTGAAIFNALDGLGRDAAAHEILDLCNGHPERQGQYHYHGPGPCLAAADGPIGYALDGFAIFGVHGEDGRELRNDDLDACHGHVATVPWNGGRKAIYHYHLTREYPYSLGCFTGTPVSMRGGHRAPPAAGGRRDPLAAAAAELGVDVATLRRAVGPPPPDIERAARQLGIDRERLRAVLERHRPR